MKMTKDELVKVVVDCAVLSLKEEVTAHPKFGLVTKESQGKHKDMDYNTFIKSIEAISPYLYEYAKEGFNLNENTFLKLREIGKQCEVDMFMATDNVNTHKGIVFLLGLLLPIIIDCVYNDKSFDKISDNIRFLARNLKNDFKDLDKKENLTYGEKVYLEYGIMGIRGVVIDGCDIAFKLLNEFENYKNDINSLVINILLNCMSLLDDTVILHKKSIETLEYIKARSKVIIALGGFDLEDGKNEVFKFTEECIDLKISPGGSADLVSVVLTLLKIKERFYKGN